MKRILLSYENYGALKMSKQHYADELARSGDQVCFINRVVDRSDLRDKKIGIHKSHVQVDDKTSICVLDLKMALPQWCFEKVRFLWFLEVWFWLYPWLLLEGYKKATVWSFDCGMTIPTAIFWNNPFVFFPVDGPFHHQWEKKLWHRSRFILTTNERLKAFHNQSGRPTFMIGHGLAPAFLNRKGVGARQYAQQCGMFRVAYAGSFRTDAIDWEALLGLATTLNDVHFDFYGETPLTKSQVHEDKNISKRTGKYFREVSKLPNTEFHGVLQGNEFVRALNMSDLLLMCYKNPGDNSARHKTYEYLSTGRPVIAKKQSSFDAWSDNLIYQIDEENFVEDASDLVMRIRDKYGDFYNATLVKERIEFVRPHSYPDLIAKIRQYEILYLNQS